MTDNVNSDRIVWSDSAIEELRQKLTDPTIIDDAETYGVAVPDDLIGEIEDYVNPEADPGVPENSDTIYLPPPPPVETEVDFPWPISIKSNTVWYGADMKSNDDVTLTWTDVPGVTDYEVRITRT